MRKAKKLKTKISTFCLDCEKDPQKCGKNPLECMKEARLYFEMYDRTAGWKNVS